MNKLTPDRLAEIMERVDGALETVTTNIFPMRQAREALEADIPDLIAEVERLREENTRLRAELEAAKRDMRALSDEYKFCNMCKYHNGEGVDTCSHPLKFSCDAENFYEWRSMTENGGGGDE